MAAEEIGEGSISQSLPDDVIEMILSFLSISDLPKAGLVCKNWYSFIASSPVRRALSHSLHKCKPWLFLFGAKKGRGLGFDPVARRWIRLPRLGLNPCEQDAILMEGNGFLFTFTGNRLKFTDSFLNPGKWIESASALRVWRQNPLICCDGEKVIVIGGVNELEENPLSVEMYDLNSGEWEMCDPLPGEFKHSASSTWLSSAVFDGKIYVLEKFKGDCCCYELQSKRWGKVMNVRPLMASSSSSSQFVKYFCLACRVGLVIARLMIENGEISFQICVVEENKMERKEAGTEIGMPGEMLKLITGRESSEEEEGGEYSSYFEDIECRSAGDLVYVFNKSRYVNRRRVCLFDFNTGVWEMLVENGDCLFRNSRESVSFLCSPVLMESLVFKA